MFDKLKDPLCKVETKEECGVLIRVDQHGQGQRGYAHQNGSEATAVTLIGGDFVYLIAPKPAANYQRTLRQ